MPSQWDPSIWRNNPQAPTPPPIIAICKVRGIKKPRTLDIGRLKPHFRTELFEECDEWFHNWMQRRSTRVSNYSNNAYNRGGQANREPNYQEKQTQSPTNENGYNKVERLRVESGTDYRTLQKPYQEPSPNEPTKNNGIGKKRVQGTGRPFAETCRSGGDTHG